MLHVVLVHGELVNRAVGQHLEFAHPVVDIIVVVGVVLESVDFVQGKPPRVVCPKRRFERWVLNEP